MSVITAAARREPDDPPHTVDVAVIGLGVHGSAVVYELAQRGLSVVGIDAQTPPAPHGSSHGRTCIIREAYFEHPLYVPLVQRAYELWSALEELTGTVLYRQTGGVCVGEPAGALVAGALRSAREHSIDHELLDATQLRQRFPALQPQPDHAGLVERRAGVLLAEPCIRTLLQLAEAYGAVLQTATSVRAWRSDAAGVVVTTSRGTVRAKQLVIAAGAWLNPVLGLEIGRSTATSQSTPLRLALTVERQVPHWFAPAPGRSDFNAAVCPVTIVEYAPGRHLYTLPDMGAGVKAGIHHEGALVEADTVDLSVLLDDETRLRFLLEAWMPGAAESVIDATVCLYTNTPDHHFLIDFHPSHDRVLLISACSGHGFKFAPAIGELAADLLLDGGSWTDLTLFGVDRLL
jgi:sarcosine oxidase